MTTFGADHRQLVQDTNEGRVVAPTVQATQVSGGLSEGRATTFVGEHQVNPLAKALVNIAGTAATAAVKEKTRLDELRGFAAAGELDGYQKIKENESVFNDLFGPSATMRGAQRRIVEDIPKKSSLKWDEAIRKDMYTKSPDEFQELLEIDVDEQLAKFDGDEEMQLLLKEQYANEVRKATETHTIANNTFVQQQQFIADQTALVRSSEQFTSDSLSGNPERIAKGKANISATLAKVMEGRTPEAQRNLITGAVLTELADGRSELYEVAYEQGYIQQLEHANKTKVDNAVTIYEQKNDAQFRQSRATLAKAVSEGDEETFYNMWPHFSNRYPNAVSDKNAMLDQLEANAELKAKKKALEVDAQYRYGTGDVTFGRHTKENQQIGMDNYFSDRADAFITSAPDYNGAPPTQAQRNKYYRTQAADYATGWGRGNLVSPQVQNALNHTLALSRSEDITPEQASELRSGLLNYAVLRGENDMLLAKHINKSQAAQLEDFYQRVIGEDEDPRSVAQEHKIARDREAQGFVAPPIDQDYLQESVDAIFNDFKDTKSERPWYFFGRKDIDGEQRLRADIQRKIEQRYRVHGNIGIAKYEAKHAILSSGSVINQQYVPNGAVMDKQSNYNVETFVNDWMDDPAFIEDATTNYGFPVNFRDARQVLPEENFFTSDKPGIEYTPTTDGRIMIQTILPSGERSRPYILKLPTSDEHLAPTEETTTFKEDVIKAKDRAVQAGKKLWMYSGHR